MRINNSLLRPMFGLQDFQGEEEIKEGMIFQPAYPDEYEGEVGNSFVVGKIQTEPTWTASIFRLDSTGDKLEGDVSTADFNYLNVGCNFIKSLPLLGFKALFEEGAFRQPSSKNSSRYLDILSHIDDLESQ